VQKERDADKSEPDSRREDGHNGGGDETPQRNERAASGDAAHVRRQAHGFRAGQYLVFEHVVSKINAHEESGVENSRP